MKRTTAFVLATLMAGSPLSAGVASAENSMNYKLESVQEAASLTRAGGSLGMRVGPKDEITSQGLTFRVLGVEGVNKGSPAAEAGLEVGDQIIAVDNRVFPNVKTFAQYVGSIAPGKKIEVDYMPPKGGPEDAKRVGVTVGERGKAATPDKTAEKSSGGLSTGQKIAIGVAAAAIFGCYKTNCYSKLKSKFGGGDKPKQLPAPH